ncbi:hypothetical protein PUN28_001751 [Cardiocondyla obscurior]|uniref:Uncharacterized protein n=1 Tax=Cardiocondyla obscurior TaxID=286306 RepID=A0AAW2GQY2_9HYME
MGMLPGLTSNARSTCISGFDYNIRTYDVFEPGQLCDVYNASSLSAFGHRIGKCEIIYQRKQWISEKRNYRDKCTYGLKTTTRLLLYSLVYWD